MTDHALSRDDWPDYWKRRLPNGGVPAPRPEPACQCQALDAIPFVIDWNLIRPSRRTAIKHRIWAHDVIRLCAAFGDISVDNLKGPRRCYQYVIPRQAAIYLMATHCGHMSFPMIGQKMGGRDHSTVSHGKKRVQLDLDSGGLRFGIIVEYVESHLGLR